MKLIQAGPDSLLAHKRLATIAGGGALLLLLSACFGGAGNTSSPTGEKVDPAYDSYYSQVLFWAECGDGAECTTVRVPRDWDNPSTITDGKLAVTRHRATGTAQGSLFVNPGGPGGSGFDFIHDSVDYAVSKALQKNFDIVGWDPRGVGKSMPVSCYRAEKLDDFIFGLPADAPESPEWKTETVQAAVDFGKACLLSTGPSLEFVDTQSTVRDLDLMRALVGDAKLNYLGYSYGSDIGMYYLQRFPDKVGRIVLDGATDSTATSHDVTLTQTIGFERALTNYLRSCPSTDDCPFSGDLAADLALVRSLYDRYDANPTAASDGRLMDGGVLDIAVSTALYSQDSWPELNTLFDEVQNGKTEQAFYLADSYFGRDVDGSYADNSLESFIAISCLDYPVETDPAVIAAENAEIHAAAPITARTTSLGDPVCANWPFSYRGAGITALTGAGAPPIIIVSTTGDPATPYEWGVALSRQLESAHLITYNGEGHTAYNQGVECVDGAVDDYFVAGTVPASDPDC